MAGPRRPVLRWQGGKWLLAPWIIAQFPPHRVYVEPFGGAGSVLLRKPRAYGEVWNDLDDEVVELFRVLRDADQSAALVRALRLTPFARTEFRAAYEPSQDPVERSRRLVIRSFMGFGSNAHASGAKGHRSTGFRGNSNRSGTTPARDWASYPDCLAQIIDRLAGVMVECWPAGDILAQHDGPDTLFYVDPPYLPELRSPSNKYDLRWRMYRHELGRDDHAALLEQLAGLVGMVVLSGYADDLYDERLAGWRRLEKATYAAGALPRTEILWINPAAWAARDHGFFAPEAEASPACPVGERP